MNDKDLPSSFGKMSSSNTEKPREKSSSSTGSTMSERSVMSPSAAPNDYYERVAAAMGNKTASGQPIQKMTSDNYQEIYRQQQASLQKHIETAIAESESKKAAEAKRLSDINTREKHLSSQIEAWKRTLGNDPDTDSRTRATIDALSRELANLRKPQ